MPRALIFANGDFNNTSAIRSLVHTDDVVIAADGGARHALSLGLIPSTVIGDLDSLSYDEVQALTDFGSQILRYPENKDETDLELALFQALHAGYTSILIFGAYGGRLDQALGNIAMLSSPEAFGEDIRLEDGVTEVFFVSSKAEIHGAPGDIVSFLPWGSPVEGVSTEGLLYPLYNETLFPNRTRSISNQILGQSASVMLKTGLLLCIHIRKN